MTWRAQCDGEYAVCGWRLLPITHQPPVIFVYSGQNMSSCYNICVEKLDRLLERTAQGYYGQEVSYDIPMSIYPTKSEIIIINSPGAGGAGNDDRKSRWDILGEFIQQQNIGTFIKYNHPAPDAHYKFPNEPYSHKDASWNQLVVESLIHVINYAIENSREICGSETPTLYLSGFSAGGSACGAVAHLYPEIRQILLLSAYDSVGDYFFEGIGEFTGEIYMAYGAEDMMAGFLAYTMRFIAKKANMVHVQEIPDCNHGFRGDTNDRILSKAFSWAFAGDDTFPSPDGGILLYEE